MAGAAEAVADAAHRRPVPPEGVRHWQGGDVSLQASQGDPAQQGAGRQDHHELVPPHLQQILRLQGTVEEEEEE